MPDELLPTNIQFGTVVGRFGSAPLIAGDADGLPDFSPATGLTVTFTPSTAAVIDATASPAPVTIEMVPIVCGLDTQGYLVGGDGQRGVKLIATDDTDINPSGWTYSVTFLRAGAKVAAFRDFSMSLPSGTTKDIALTIPVPSSSGVSLSQAQAAEAAAVSAASQASASAAAAAASVALFSVDNLPQAGTTGKALAKASDTATAQTAIGATAVGKALVTAANASAGRTALSAVERPAASLNSLTGWFHADGFGFSPSNTATQNDAAFTAALAAMPSGGTLYIPPGKYAFTSLNPTRSIHIRGAGASVNTRLRYADAAWATTPNLGGTLLVSVKTTTGGAIELPPTEAANNSTIADLSIIGPGTGSSTGLILGGSGGGYPVRARLRHVTIANFSTGFLGSNENGQFDGLWIVGCTDGFTTMYPFNGNVINGLNVEYTDNIAVRLLDARSNTFNGGVFQANYGSKVISVEANAVACVNNTFKNPYLENFGPANWEEISVGVVGSLQCGGNAFTDVECDSALTNTPMIRFGSKSLRNTITSHWSLVRVQLDTGAAANKISGYVTGLANNSGQVSNSVDDASPSRLGGLAPIYMANASDLWAKDSSGTPQRLVGYNALNRMTLTNPKSSLAPEIRFYEDTSGIAVLLNNAVVFKWTAGSSYTMGTPLTVGSSAAAPSIRSGAGSPDNVVFADAGSLYLRTDGGYGTSVYVKATSSAFSSGWVSLGNGVPLTNVAANYTMLRTDELVVANGGAVTVTLLDPSGALAPSGRTITVKNVNAAAVTVVSAGTSKTIDGAASASLAQWAARQYVSDGTQWLSI